MRAKIAKPVSHFVKVDAVIPGCPVEPSDIEQVLAKLLLKIVQTKPANFPVCLECKKNQNECFLQKGKLCFGPITVGGCNSTCINAGFPCLGCRGILPGANISAFLKTLKTQKIPLKEFQQKRKIFLAKELSDSQIKKLVKAKE